MDMKTCIPARWHNWLRSMIKLTKGPKPEILSANAAAWTADLIHAIGLGDAHKKTANSIKSRYRHPDIKTALLKETNGKCAYCESLLRHVTYGDIEHMTAKASSPEATFEWDNLTVACDVCNTKKAENSVIDPYMSEPEERILFFGPAAIPKAGDNEAELTLRRLDLNRPELLGRRTEKIENLQALRKIISGAPSDLRIILEKDFENELQDSREYASLSRSFHRFLDQGNH